MVDPPMVAAPMVTVLLSPWTLSSPLLPLFIVSDPPLRLIVESPSAFAPCLIVGKSPISPSPTTAPLLVVPMC